MEHSGNCQPLRYSLLLTKGLLWGDVRGQPGQGRRRGSRVTVALRKGTEAMAHKLEPGLEGLVKTQQIIQPSSPVKHWHHL